MVENSASGRLVVVGKVLAPRGLAGEVRIEVISDSPGRFAAGGILFLNGRPHKILRSTDLPRGKVALKLDYIDSHLQAEGLRGCLLTVPEEMVPPLSEGEFYHYQIIDMEVYDQQGECLGKITQIFPTGSNDVYVVSHEGRDLLVPALVDVIMEVDVEKGTMTVDLPEGLI